MSLIITPRQLAQRSELYYQLSSLISAGLPIIQALEQMHRSPPSFSYRPHLQKMIHALNQGCTFTDAVIQSGNWMPTFDVALLSAGEKSGRLDACCRLLSGYYHAQADIARQVFRNMLYPFFLIHFALIVFPTKALVGLALHGDVAGYFKTKLILLPFYAAGIAILYACQGQRGEAWRAMMEHIMSVIPLVGSARRNLAISRLASALEALLNAGVPIFNAWELAASASGSPALRMRVLSWRPELERGMRPSEMIRASREFPEMFANLYHSGEISGKHDEALLRLRDYYQEEGSRKLQMVAEWVPRLVYIAVAIFIAFEVVSFYSGYFNQINQLTQ